MPLPRKRGKGIDYWDAVVDFYPLIGLVLVCGQ